MKISAFTKARNRSGKLFNAFKCFECKIINKVDKSCRESKQDRSISTNAEHNWTRTNNGEKVWNF